ncbi:MAG: glycosyltransferase family 4 protein, partial [Planctomycetes bacterium]|nr:glycosyltransferase family 4 protein [Planctomycetota bacterium]
VAMCQARGWPVSVALAYPVPEVEDRVAQDNVLRLYELPAYRRHLGRLRKRWGLDRRRAGSVFSSCWSALRTDLPIAVRLASFAHRRGVDLIHANNELLVNRTAILAARMIRRPVVSHQRGWAGRSRLTRLLGRWTDRVVAISDYVTGTLIEAGLDGLKIQRIYDGVDCERFGRAADRRVVARRALGLAATDEVIGLPAVLLPWKGHDMFLTAFARLADGRPNLRALLVGASPAGAPDLSVALRGQAAKLGVADRVCFTGHVAEMVDMYAAMDLVVHASQQPEPFGLVVVEAMAAGKPVIAADAGGPAEIIRHGTDGWLYPMGDAAALTSAMARLLDDRPLRDGLAQRAPLRAAAFDQTATDQAIAALYTDLLSQTRSIASSGLILRMGWHGSRYSGPHADGPHGSAYGGPMPPNTR